MAVIIDIPGIGRVSAENAAEEATLKQILAVMQKSEKTKRKEERTLEEAQKRQAKVSKDTVTEMDKLIESTEEVQKSQAKVKTATNDVARGFTTAAKDTGAAAVSFAKSVGLSAVSIAASFAKNFDAIGENPIDAGAALLNTGIDLAAKGVTVVTSGVKAVGSALGGIPVIGPVINGFVSGAAEAANAAAQLAAELAKAANQILANELKKSIEAMNTLAKSGASFGGGLTELRTIANKSGLDLKTFSTVVSTSRDEITRMGLSASEGAKFLSTGLTKLANTTGTSGNSLRSEMLALGYGYEEQGALMAQYSANMAASGKLRSMSDADLAKGTAQYAKDLKILADITGKDAKKAMEEAAKKSMEADIMAQLSPEEAEKFQKAYAAMPDYAKKGFLEYVASGGTAIADKTTNIMMAQNAEYEKLIKGSYDAVKDGSKNAQQVQDETYRQSVVAAKNAKDLNKEQGNAIGLAARMTGTNQEIADAQNAQLQDSVKDIDAAQKSRDAANKQAEATDEATKGYIEAYDAAKKFQVEMEQLATKYLPEYSKLLATAIKETADILGKVAGNIGSAEGKEKQDAEIKKIHEEQAAQREANAKEAEQVKQEAIDKAKAEGSSSLGQWWAGAKASAGFVLGGGYNQGYQNYEAPEEYAKGGIASGPKDGFMAMLHGTEAVIPLPDGKSIPLDTSGMQSMVSRLSDIKQDENTSPEMLNLMSSFKDTYKALDNSIASVDKHSPEEMMDNLKGVFKDSFTSANSGSVDAQKRMVELMEQFLERTTEMERHLYDQKGFTQRLLDAF